MRLPLPVTNTLPVSMNGTFALDYETRRSLWSSTEESGQRIWNNCIMELYIAPCYVAFLVSAAEKLESCEGKDLDEKINDYYRLFPRVETTFNHKSSHDMYMKVLYPISL